MTALGALYPPQHGKVHVAQRRAGHHYENVAVENAEEREC